MAIIAQRLTAEDLAVTPQHLHARSIVADIDRNRLVVDASSAGRTQESIAADLGLSQATVHRILKRREQIEAERNDPRPLEVIARYWLGQITHDQMLSDLLARTYSAGYAPEGTFDVWIPGTWDDITRAYGSGMLNRADLEVLGEKAPTE